MKEKALRSFEIAPVPPVPITPGREAAADGEATEDIINKIAQLSETSATSPHRLLARACSIKRNPSRQASTPSRKKVKPSADMAGGPSEDDEEWGDVFDSDMKSCLASVVGSSAAAGASVPAAFPLVMQHSPLKVGTSQASALSSLSPLLPQTVATPKAGGKGGGKRTGKKGSQGSCQGTTSAIVAARSYQSRISKLGRGSARKMIVRLKASSAFSASDGERPITNGM